MLLNEKKMYWTVYVLAEYTYHSTQLCDVLLLLQKQYLIKCHKSALDICFTYVSIKLTVAENIGCPSAERQNKKSVRLKKAPNEMLKHI